MPTRNQDVIGGTPGHDEPATWLVPSEPHSTERPAVSQLPCVAADQQCPGPQMFALVDAVDPDRVYYYGIDVGAGAFTVRRDPDSRQTDFGSWISMRTAFERLDGMAGGPGRLALVVFDSVPAVPVTAIEQDGPALAAAPTNELEYRAQSNWRGNLLDSVHRCIAHYRKMHVAECSRDPQAGEDRYVQGVKRRIKGQQPLG